MTVFCSDYCWRCHDGVGLHTEGQLRGEGGRERGREGGREGGEREREGGRGGGREGRRERGSCCEPPKNSFKVDKMDLAYPCQRPDTKRWLHRQSHCIKVTNRCETCSNTCIYTHTQ